MAPNSSKTAPPTPRIFVSDQTKVDRYSCDPSGHIVRAPNGSPIRGVPLDLTDPRLPDTLFHVTAAARAVRASKLLRATGSGGLGGDSYDQIVSFTTKRSIADQLAADMRLLADAASSVPLAPPVNFNSKTGLWEGGEARLRWAQPLIHFFANAALEQDWEFSPGISRTYGFSDYQTAYFVQRESRTRIPNPLFFSADQAAWAARTKADIDVIAIPRASLATGALLTNFDLDRPTGLSEVRLYGDVPLPPTPPEILFHHAPSSLRPSILLNGLLVSYDQTSSPGGSSAIYLTDTPSPSPNTDVWEVDTANLDLTPDYTEREDENWYAVFRDIVPDRLTLLSPPQVELPEREL